MKYTKKGKVLAVVMAAVLFAVALTGCTGNKKQVVKIATKPMTEQLILGEMLALLVEQNTDATVEITKGIGGGTSNIHPALVKGDFDLYPEYTGTGWYNVLHRTDTPDDDTLYQQLQRGYSEEFGLEWVGQYGFNNTYAITVRKSVADQYSLSTCSDLAAAAPQLTFGGNGDFFEREDGFNAICDAYGWQFGNTVDIDIGLKYTALASGDIDVTNGYTTDAQLNVADAVVLEDDLHYFKNYYAGTVVRQDALDRVPGLRMALMMMEGILSDSEMAALSYEVEINGRNEKEVAKDYLTKKGLL